MFCARLSLYLHVMQRKSSPAVKKIFTSGHLFFFVQKQRAEAELHRSLYSSLKYSPMKTLKLGKKRPVLAPHKQVIIEGRHNRAVKNFGTNWGTGNLSILPTAIFTSDYIKKTATGYFGSGRPMPMLSI